MPTRRDEGWSSLWRRAAPAVELFGLTGLVVTQPVLDAFADSPETFVSRGAGALDVILFALCIAFFPALALWGAELLVGLVREAPRRWLHLGFIALLVGLLAIEVGKAQTDLGYKRLPVAAALVGLAFAALYARFAPVRSWLRLLGLAPLVFVALFLVVSPAREIAFPSTAGSDSTVVPERPAPVVMVVLDELPTASLLGGEGLVNATAFPNFARLAADATWYRNHTSVAPFTAEAVPAILTGDYPTGSSPPLASEHPENLFSLLESSYELHVTESYTRLCSAEQCRPSSEDGGGNALGDLLGDAADIWREQVSPKRAPEALPFGFATADLRAGKRMEDFARSLSPSTTRRPRLDFLHVQLPHVPYHYLPDGQEYDAPADAGVLFTVWSAQQPADVARSRHLLQLQYTDRLLGRVLRRLQQLGTYDESLVVVTADHGAAFTAEDTQRGSSDGNYHEVMWTPLFVKAPGQQREEVSDQPVRAIDVVPTIAGHLGIELPWDVDGTSVLDEPRDPAEELRFFRSDQDVRPPEEGDFHTYDGREGYRRMLAGAPRLVEDGGGPFGLFARGEYGHLLGRQVREMLAGPAPDVVASFDNPSAFEDVDVSAPPVYVSGEIESDTGVDVVVAVNGVVGGWADARAGKDADPEVYERFGFEPPPGGPDTARVFATMVPPELFRDGDNDVGIFVVNDVDGGETLAPARMR